VALAAGLVAVPAVDEAQEGGEQLAVPGQPLADLEGEAEHPLAGGRVGQDVVDEVGGGVGPAAAQAGGASSGASCRSSSARVARGKVVEVSDSGPGIAEAALDQVFVPFCATKHEGSGIGLSLYRELMRLHGGSIGVRSQPGVHTVFVVEF